MLAIDTSNNVKICKVSYCEVNMVSVTSYTYPTETENDNSQFQSQKLRESINTSLESNISKFNTMEQSGLLDNCRTLSKDATFREVFRSLLFYILDSFHIYRHDINDKLVPYFHVTPESENANYKTWIAVTGMDSYTKIEQTGSNKFKVTDMYREFNDEKKCLEQKYRDRDFSGRNVEEFIGLLSAHDRLEKDSNANSKLTVAADILKQELAINNRDDRFSLQSEAEKIMMGVLKEREGDKLIPKKHLHQTDTKKLTLYEKEFNSLIGDTFRQVSEGSSRILCCGVKINDTIRNLLEHKVAELEKVKGFQTYNSYEELFNKIIFTNDECQLVRDSLNEDSVSSEKIGDIISSLSTSSGIGNLYYACSQAFHGANDYVHSEVLTLVENVGGLVSNYPAFVALNGRNNALFVDFSEHKFKQTYYILRAVQNNEAGNFKLANFIYTTETNLLNNNTDAGSVIEIKESSSIKRTFTGNVTIEAFN
ncbi:hypothetical protein H3284_10300 [Escherichia coli]|uniref:hypothetical protein n=1 Tax=Escherichia coli TaxID=562 RepID=UPI001981FBDE|nr:hypothetical protein [Escherichia coli]MBN4656439.1 hypothetical protein [Escherichia coli]MBN4671511.1 hypothetical protein [Escherichia coli]